MIGREIYNISSSEWHRIILKRKREKVFFLQFLKTPNSVRLFKKVTYSLQEFTQRVIRE